MNIGTWKHQLHFWKEGELLEVPVTPWCLGRGPIKSISIGHNSFDFTEIRWSVPTNLFELLWQNFYYVVKLNDIAKYVFLNIIDKSKPVIFA